MGLRRIDESPKPLSPEEWCRRETRKHNLQRWAITLVEIAFMAAVVWAMKGEEEELVEELAPFLWSQE